MKKIIFLLLVIFVNYSIYARVLIGTYYFGGWAGHKGYKIGNIDDPPTHLTPLLVSTYKEREPIWGWRDDKIKIMEQQIDLASKNGIDFFIFCWYWSKDKSDFYQKGIESCPLNNCLDLFLKAKNNYKMKFAILIANHEGFTIQGEQNWVKVIDYLSLHYFKNSQYLKIDGRPYLSIFYPKICVPYIISMNRESIKHNFSGLYLNSCWSLAPGYDMMTWYNIRLPEHGFSERQTYQSLINHAENVWAEQSLSINISPVVMSGWDNRPWETNKNRGVYCINKTPQLFKRHLKNAIDFINKRAEKNKIVLIYAWNELGEGGYLVPTKVDPKGIFLRMVKEARKETRIHEKF